MAGQRRPVVGRSRRSESIASPRRLGDGRRWRSGGTAGQRRSDSGSHCRGRGIAGPVSLVVLYNSGSQLVWLQDPQSFVIDKLRPRNIFNISNFFNENMLQFVPDIKLNITVCQ